MRRFLNRAVLPLLAALLFAFPAVSQAQFYWGWGWNYPSYYSSYYTPSYYSSYYTPTYTSYYSPTRTSYYSPTRTSYYTASYASSACCDTGCCGVTCCSPCATACCSPCGNCGVCADCCGGDCDLASSRSGNQGNTTIRPRAESGSGQPTFIEEEDRGTGTGTGSNYESPNSGTGDGFQPRNSNDADPQPDPLDNQTFGTSSAGGRDELRFKVPTTDIKNEESETQDSPARRVNKQEEPHYPLLKLDEKITSRTLPQRTRLVERRSWQPMVAENVTRQSPADNLGWVPVPAPAQVAQK